MAVHHVGTRYERWVRVLLGYGFALESVPGGGWDPLAQVDPPTGALRVRLGRQIEGLPDAVVDVRELWVEDATGPIVEGKASMHAAGWHGQFGRAQYRWDCDPLKPRPLRSHLHRSPNPDARVPVPPPSPEEFVAGFEQFIWDAQAQGWA